MKAKYISVSGMQDTLILVGSLVSGMVGDPSLVEHKHLSMVPITKAESEGRLFADVPRCSLFKLFPTTY